MKHLLTALLAFAGMAGFGQILPSDIGSTYPDSAWHLEGTHKKVTRRFFMNGAVTMDGGNEINIPLYRHDTTDEVFARKLDTIDVWRMVCDTTPGLGHGVKMMSIKEMRELHNSRENVMDPGWCINCNYQDYWRHIKYLTAGGHRLPKGMVVIEMDAFLANQEPEYAVTPDPPPPPDTSHATLGNLIGNISFDTILHPVSPPVSGFNVEGGGIYWQPQRPILNPSWLPRRFRKRYEIWLKKQHHE